MKIVIQYQNNKTLVEFNPETFKKLLTDYYKQTKDIGKALDKIKEDLTNEILKI